MCAVPPRHHRVICREHRTLHLKQISSRMLCNGEHDALNQETWRTTRFSGIQNVTDDCASLLMWLSGRCYTSSFGFFAMAHAGWTSDMSSRIDISGAALQRTCGDKSVAWAGPREQYTKRSIGVAVATRGSVPHLAACTLLLAHIKWRHANMLQCNETFTTKPGALRKLVYAENTIFWS